MTDNEIKAGLRGLDPQHEFFRALMALLDQEIEIEQDGVCQKDLMDGGRQFNAGRLARARDTKSAIVGVIQQAHLEEQERLAKVAREEARKEQERQNGNS